MIDLFGRSARLGYFPVLAVYTYFTLLRVCIYKSQSTWRDVGSDTVLVIDLLDCLYDTNIMSPRVTLTKGIKRDVLTPKLICF